jgi:N utilization substance protein B
VLFAVEASGASPELALRDYWREFPGDAEGRSYAETVVRGVLETRDAMDRRITAASENWRLERMTRVDRNVLRIGTWELVSRMDVPRAVILDESVELAKKFGTDESGAFVNGVLAKIADECGRLRETEPSPGESGD